MFIKFMAAWAPLPNVRVCETTTTCESKVSDYLLSDMRVAAVSDSSVSDCDSRTARA